MSKVQEVDWELNSKVASLVEPEPDPVTDEDIDDLSGSVPMFRSHRSPKGCWYITRIYENGDVPEWRPVNFSGQMVEISWLADEYFDGEPQILMERYRNQQTDSLTWMAYSDMTYGYGESAAEALCDMLVRFDGRKEER